MQEVDRYRSRRVSFDFHVRVGGWIPDVEGRGYLDGIDRLDFATKLLALLYCVRMLAAGDYWAT